MAMHLRTVCDISSPQLTKSYALVLGELMIIWLSTRILIGQVTNQIDRASLEVLLCSTEVQYHGQARSKRQYQRRAVNQSTLLSQHVLSKVKGSPNCFET
jgi:hypothetical protein